jgi:cytochrome P450
MFVRPRQFASAVDSLFGPSVFTLEGEKWKKERKLLTPLFHFAALKHYSTYFDSLGKALIEKLSMTDGKTISSTCLREFTMRGIIKSAFGDGIDISKVEKAQEEISNSFQEFFAVISLFGSLANYLPLPVWRRVDKARKSVEKAVNDLVVKRRLEPKNESEPNDLISLLLSTEKETLSEEFITSEGMIFLFAGTDSTATLLVRKLYNNI